MTGLSELLKELKPIQGGESAEDILTAKRLNAIQECIKMIATGRNVSAAGGVYKRESAGGYSLWGKKSFSELNTPAAKPPFWVSTAGADDSGTPQLIVELDSWLMQDETWDSKVTITGLGAAFAVSAEEKVWLEVTLDATGTVTTATIEHAETGGTDWADFPNPIETAGSDQIYYHLLAGLVPITDATRVYENWETITFPDDSTRQLVPTTQDNLIVCAKCSAVNGQLAYVLAPWFRPYLAL
jgi:hypothetical protein